MMNQTSQPQLELTKSDRTFVLVMSSIGGFLVTFMASSINIALPLIQADFQMSAVMLSWVSMSYILMSGAVLLPMGRVADLYGRMRLFKWSMIIFTVMSFASAFAPSTAVLLAFRAIHGIGLAIGSVTSTAVLVLAYPRETRGRALGLNVSCVYLGVTLGPVLGGLIVHHLGWRSLFIVVGALSLVNVALPFWKLRGVEWREPKKARFDLLGTFIYAAALTALLLGFSLVPDISGTVLLSAGIVGVVVFLWWETRAADPLLNIDLFRKSRVFAFSNVAALINYSATAAAFFLMSLYLQYIRGLDAQTAGLVLVTGPLVQAVMSPVVGRMVDRVNARYVASSGMVVCFAGLLGLSFIGADTAFWYIILTICMLCVGIALFGTPITHIIMSSVETSYVGVASATLSTTRQAGMSLSQGVATLVLALVVGRQAIQPADYPALLTSVRISYLIFTVLCAIGLGAALVGPRRRRGDKA